jgi:hypothetical protein
VIRPAPAPSSCHNGCQKGCEDRRPARCQVRRSTAALAFLASLAVPAAAAAEPEYELRLPAEVDVTAGTDEAVSLTIAPVAGRTISADGPLLITVSADPDGAVTLPRRRYGRADAADARAEAPRFDLRFAAARAGEARLRVAVLFWVCGKRSCRPFQERREVQVRAIPPGPAAPAP